MCSLTPELTLAVGLAEGMQHTRVCMRGTMSKEDLVESCEWESQCAHLHQATRGDSCLALQELQFLR